MPPSGRRRELRVDGGTPPPPPSEHGDTLDPDQQGLESAAAVEVAALPPEGDDVGWTLEAVDSIVGVAFLLVHVTIGRSGPEDAYLPTDDERATMSRPLHSILQRSMRTRALGRYGDGVALVTATGGYMAAETARVAHWKDEHAGEQPPPPDADVEGLGTRAARPGDPDVRAWRPPNVPPE